MSNVKKICEFLVMFAMSGLCSAYEMPVGIPSFGWASLDPVEQVTPPTPATWNSEVEGFYYVEPSNGASTDSGNGYGYPSKPRKSMPSSIQPGEQVILAGTFNANQSVSNYNCSAEAPCWIRGISEAEAPTLPENIKIRDSSYLFIENLDFNGGSNGALFISGKNTHHVVIRNNKIRNREWTAITAAIASTPDLGGVIHDLVIYNNLFSDLGDYTATEDKDFQGFNPTLWNRDSATSQYNVWFLENVCERLSGDCIQINAGNWTNSEDYLHHIYVGKNVASQNRQGGYWVKQARDVIISQNVAHDMNGGGAGNAGHGIGVQYQKNNVWFIFNEVYSSVFGFRQSDTSNRAEDIYVVGNIFHDIRPAPGSSYDPTNQWDQGVAIALWHGGSNRYVVDNIIHNTYDGLNALYSGYIEFYGNIISQVDNASGNHFFVLEHPARNDLVKMDYNLFVDDSQGTYYSWWDNAKRTSISQIQTASGGQCMNCVEKMFYDSSELFANVNTSPELRDFSLKAGALAVSSSTKHWVYDKFKELYGLDIYVDFYGRPRSSSAPSMGATELATTKYPPSAPQLLE